MASALSSGVAIRCSCQDADREVFGGVALYAFSPEGAIIGLSFGQSAAPVPVPQSSVGR